MMKLLNKFKLNLKQVKISQFEVTRLNQNLTVVEK
jgi:hypothetical protein